MRTLRKLHRWLGLALALPMLLQGLTGVLMLLLPLLASQPRLSHPASGPMRSAERLVADARAAMAEPLVAMSYTPPRFAGDVALVGFGTAGARRPDTQVALDPVSGALVRIVHAAPLLGVVHDLHTMLLIPVFGHSVIGWAGLGLLFLSLSGLVLWWPGQGLRRSGKWRCQFVVQPRARGRSLARQIHYALGGWLLLMLALMSATGATMSFPGIVNPLLHLPAPSEHRRDGGSPDGPVHGRHGGSRHGDGGGDAADGVALPPAEQGLDQAMARVMTELPGTVRVAEIGFGRSTAPFTARVVLAGLAPGQVAMVSVGRNGGPVTLTRDPRHQRGGARLLAWVHMLHEAKLPAAAPIAVAWRVLVGLTGAALALFSITGVLMWASKRRPVRVPAGNSVDREHAT